MSDSPGDDPRARASDEGPGILASLPSTRPQRATARRAAARAVKSSADPPRQARATASRQPPVRPAKTGSAGKRRKPTRSDAPAQERAPRQGFEAEPDSLGPVQPPSSAELVSSAAELAGELAKAGVTTGARVLRDLLSRLP